MTPKVSARCNAASCKGNPWYAAHKSNTFPCAAQLGLKQRKMLRCRSTENVRPRSLRDWCRGQGPRSWGPQPLLFRNRCSTPRCCKTCRSVTCRRSAAKSSGPRYGCREPDEEAHEADGGRCWSVAVRAYKLEVAAVTTLSLELCGSLWPAAFAISWAGAATDSPSSPTLVGQVSPFPQGRRQRWPRPTWQDRSDPNGGRSLAAPRENAAD